jgi:hypothetical protein
MNKLIRKYASGTPEPFSVAIKRTVSTEKEAAEILVASKDKNGSADKVGSSYVVRYRRWFQTLPEAEAFVAASKSKTKSPSPKEEKKVEASKDEPKIVETAKVKEDLTKMVSIMKARGKEELVSKTQAVLGKI